MKIDLAGFGPGRKDLVTWQLTDVLRSAEVIITSARLAGILREDQSSGAETRISLRSDVCIIEETRSAKICAFLEELAVSGNVENVLCLFGGDSCFYSGAAPLLKLIEGSDILQDRHVETRMIPGISSLSAACARLKISMREIEVFSAHGRKCDPVRAVMNGKKSFFLTAGSKGPANLCSELTRAGLGTLEVTICEMLSTSQERIRTMTASRAAEETYFPLSVMLAEPAPVSEYLRRKVPGIADDEYIRGSVPMTKRFVRAGIISMLAPTEGELCWDLGAGTGSVSVEMSAFCRRVISVERNPEAIRLIEENRKKFGAWNIDIVQGEIPEAVRDLPVPDAVFIGGGGTKLAKILANIKELKEAAGSELKEKATSMLKEETASGLKETEASKLAAGNPDCMMHRILAAGNPDCMMHRILAAGNPDFTDCTMPRILVAAITLETLHEAVKVLKEYGYDTEIAQIAVTDVKERGQFHMMDAQNPVFLISGTCN